MVFYGSSVPVQYSCHCAIIIFCFNHRVVTLVVDKLKRHGYREYHRGLSANCINQPERMLVQTILQTLSCRYSNGYKHHTSSLMFRYLNCMCALLVPDFVSVLVIGHV